MSTQPSIPVGYVNRVSAYCLGLRRDCAVTGADYFDGFTMAITSYDYDAPLTEAGDITSKYLAIRNMTSKVCNAPRDTVIVLGSLFMAHCL